MASPKWCLVCRQNVYPCKRFSVVAFIFTAFLPYLLYHALLKRRVCPVCGKRAFGPGQKRVIEHGQAIKKW